MSREIEVKVLNIDVEEMKIKLIELGAKKIKDEYQVNTLFDVKNQLMKSGIKGYLRMRMVRDRLKEETKYEFTLKESLSTDGNARINREIETHIDNPESLIEILGILGIPIHGEGTKDRQSYQLRQMLFEIDTWDENIYPDPYMEIEVPNEEVLEDAIVLLKLDRNNITTKSIDELRTEKGLK